MKNEIEFNQEDKDTFTKYRDEELTGKTNLVIGVSLVFIGTIILMVASVLFVGNLFHKEIKEMGFLEPIETTYSAKINGQDRQVVCEDKGCFTSINYVECHDVKWSDEEVCDRQNINVLLKGIK